MGSILRDVKEIADDISWYWFRTRQEKKTMLYLQNRKRL